MAYNALNQKQLDILKLLYRFRFATSELLRQALQAKRINIINRRLGLLLEQEYIGRHYSFEHHLLRKHATYYLSPKGIRALKATSRIELDAQTLRYIYKDKHASDQYIAYCLGILATYCKFKLKVKDDLLFLTKSHLVNRYEYFLDFVPGAYIRKTSKGAEEDYFLEYLQSSKPLFAITQRIKQYFEFADSGEWEAATDSDFPKILLVCDTPSLSKRLIKRASPILSEADDELKIFITNEDAQMWHNFAKPDEALSLEQL